MPQHRTLREGEAYNGIVFTVIGGIVQKLNRHPDGVSKTHHAFEELGPHSTTLWTIMDF